jgi:hypothetical protein
MERVAFLIEDTGQRLGALLNPHGLVVRRRAGLRPRRSAGGQLTGTRLADDALLHTGGGLTELRLDLLFDVAVSGSNIQTEDVRDLTRPLWDLAENVAGDDGYGRLRLVRFVWGKAWNVPGVVAAVAERLEEFAPSGAPRRSWLRMRLLRVGEFPPPAATVTAGALAAQTGLPGETLPGAPLAPQDLQNLADAAAQLPPESLGSYEVVGGGADEAGQAAERIDELAARLYGDPTLWRLLAAFNDVADPLRLAAGQVLRLPPARFTGAP